MTDADKKRIYVALPNTGWIHRSTTRSLLDMVRVNSEKYDLFFAFSEDKPIDSNRNKIVRDFLESDVGFDYLLFMDSDNPPRKGVDPLELVELDKDIISLPTPIWYEASIKMGKEAVVWNVYNYDKNADKWFENKDRKGDPLTEIDAAGTGCMLIARRVLEKVKPAFIRKWDEHGVAVQGSDLLFCKRAKEAGFKVWTHYGYPCSHFKEIDVTDYYVHQRQRDVGFANLPNINTPEYWDEQWEERGERLYPFYDEIAARVNGGPVLDYGCGRGDLLGKLGDRAVGVDISRKAVEICESRGLRAKLIEPGGMPETNGSRWGTIVCTEVLEHVDDDAGLITKFFEHTNHLIYTVPHNCLPPGLEPEHRRVYTADTVKRITPHLKSVKKSGDYLMVEAKRDGD